MKKKLLLCGVVIDNLSRKDILMRVQNAMNDSDNTDNVLLRIATVNPDFLLRARTDDSFCRNLTQAEICLADGIGISVVGAFMGRRVQRYPGADFFFDLLEQAQREDWHVHFYCWDSGLSRWADIARAIAKRYPTLQVTGEDVARREETVFASLYAHPLRQNQESAKTLSAKNSFMTMMQKNKCSTECFCASECTCEEVDVRAHTHNQNKRLAEGFAARHVSTLYFCNFGAPAQEYFLEELRAHGARGVAVGVGGAFDFLTGNVRRAPRWMRRMGAEWLWRTVCQPKRIGKMLRSVVVFPALVLMAMMRKKCWWLHRGKVR